MACADFEKIRQLLPYLDLYLMDIKHTNPEKHKEFTGRSNELMMENARRVALSGQTRLIIRVPVIPSLDVYKRQAQCDHVNHVSTQLPYAVLAAAVSFVTYLVAGFVKTAWIALPVGFVLMFITLFVVRHLNPTLEEHLENERNK